MLVRASEGPKPKKLERSFTSKTSTGRSARMSERATESNRIAAEPVQRVPNLRPMPSRVPYRSSSYSSYSRSR